MEPILLGWCSGAFLELSVSGGGADSPVHSLQLAPLQRFQGSMAASPLGALGKPREGGSGPWEGERGAACPACWHRPGSSAGDAAGDGAAQQDPHPHHKPCCCSRSACAPSLAATCLENHNCNDTSSNSMKDLSSNLRLLPGFGLLDPKFPSSRVVVMLGNFLGADGRAACLQQGFVPIQITPKGSAARGLGCLQ